MRTAICSPIPSCSRSSSQRFTRQRLLARATTSLVASNILLSPFARLVVRCWAGWGTQVAAQACAICFPRMISWLGEKRSGRCCRDTNRRCPQTWCRPSEEFLLLQQLLLRLAAGAARGAAGESCTSTRSRSFLSFSIRCRGRALPVMVTWEPLRRIPERPRHACPDGALQPFSPLLALGKDVHGQGEAGDLLAGGGAQLGVFTEATTT